MGQYMVYRTLLLKPKTRKEKQNYRNEPSDSSTDSDKTT